MIRSVRSIHRWGGALLAGVLSVGLAASVVAAAPAKSGRSAAAPDRTTETYGVWQLRCGAANRCYLTQSIYAKKRKGLIGRMTFAMPNKKSRTLRLRVLLPLGLKIADGVRIAVDKGAVRKVPFAACLRAGCLIEMGVPSLMEKRLKVGDSVSVTAFIYGKNKPLQLRFSLKGLTRGLGRLRAK